MRVYYADVTAKLKLYRRLKPRSSESNLPVGLARDVTLRRLTAARPQVRLQLSSAGRPSETRIRRPEHS